jgi:hypothetical protein
MPLINTGSRCAALNAADAYHRTLDSKAALGHVMAWQQSSPTLLSSQLIIFQLSPFPQCSSLHPCPCQAVREQQRHSPRCTAAAPAPARLSDNSSATLAHLAAENQYYATATAGTQALEAQLKAGMQARRTTLQDAVNVPNIEISLSTPWR